MDQKMNQGESDGGKVLCRAQEGLQAANSHVAVAVDDRVRRLTVPGRTVQTRWPLGRRLGGGGLETAISIHMDTGLGTTCSIRWRPQSHGGEDQP